jgi:hypothetical protein
VCLADIPRERAETPLGERTIGAGGEKEVGDLEGVSSFLEEDANEGGSDRGREELTRSHSHNSLMTPDRRLKAEHFGGF